MKRRVVLACASVAVFGLTACTPEEVGEYLRGRFGSPTFDACGADGHSGVMTALPCNGAPSVVVTCALEIEHMHQAVDYCLTLP